MPKFGRTPPKSSRQKSPAKLPDVGLEALAAKYHIASDELPMNVEEIALRLGVSPKTIYPIAESIPGFYRPFNGRAIRFKRQPCQAWIEAVMSGKGTANE
jgi:hypothetical protein